MFSDREKALKSLDQALVINPLDSNAHYRRGNVLLGLQQPAAAIESYDRALTISPENTNALLNKGTAQLELNQPEMAIKSYRNALIIKPDLVGAHLNIGTALLQLNQPEAAIESYDQALQINPRDSKALYSRGNALLELNENLAALENYDCAISINANYVEAYFCRGNVLRVLDQLDAAIESYDQAIKRRPKFAEAYVNRGIALQQAKQMEAALKSFKKAIAINPNDSRAHFNLGDALLLFKQPNAVIDSFQRALEIDPDFEYLPGLLLYRRMEVCKWENFETQCADITHGAGQNKKTSYGFPMIAISNDMAIQRKTAEIWVNDKNPGNPVLGPLEPRKKSKKIRIGYYSADFRDHPVSILVTGLIEKHDRDKFEVYGFSLGPDTQDPMRKRLELAFDHFVDVRQKTDLDIARLSRDSGIDIAVDLGGHTGSNRAGIFALRAAPVQVNFLGYPGTLGTEYIDFIIADRHVIPEGSENHYSEKIAYLPCYQANDDKREISDRVFTRKELGLPETGFVFCSFNNSFKVTPSTFDGWMRILQNVEYSVLLLLADYAVVEENLRAEAEKRGIDPARIIFAGRLPFEEYLSRYRSLDLFLDTFPFNGGTTVSDALWAGLPTLTLSGKTFASRMANSLLNAIELPELITFTQKDYESLAIDLATNPSRLENIKAKLEQNRLTSKLFNTELFTRNLENAFTQMYDCFNDGQSADHIIVK